MLRRLIDILFALFWLIVAMPAIILIAIFIKLGSAGPILYAPHMIGKNGKLFRLYRFRTMSVDSLHAKTTTRLTRVGRWIRNYSLDHLPILVNILKGDLTIVGPRPMEPDTVDMLDTIWQDYFKVKPGLFNYAVLKLGRSWTPSRANAPGLNQELELHYQQKRSATRDFQLCIQFLRAYFASGGNVKARGTTDSDSQSKLKHP